MRTFSRWKWPKPVMLGPIASSPPVPGVAPLSVWNPRANPRDAAQLMPIITPCYPSMNSSYNVGQPQLRRIQQELCRGEQIVNGIAAAGSGERGGGRKQRNAYEWEDLFAGKDFFRQHGHYLQVNIMARNAEDFRTWFGLCESRLRILIAGLESPEYGVQCYPFAKFFREKTLQAQGADGGGEDGGPHSHVTSFFVALRFAYGVENVDLRSCTEEFLYKVNAWDDRKWGMDLTIEHRTREHLPPFVFEEDDDDCSGSEMRKTDRKTTTATVQALRAAAEAEGTKAEDDRPDLSCASGDGGNKSGHASSLPTNPSPHKRARKNLPG
uniref:polynucleotide adenylyltransferase n=2 Tax=Odontella aurita TaxID=265563 RepID=A0A7S4I6N1_9STRA|mmetsp:Transcript_20694/g.60166  ORF Transcript_20694/g.60166 Transcript_20694/m.60166 type:complete len:325 (+) Transcript_20694:1567-2541(+)